ncbi:conserved hypothetical protein [Cupriavidus taiwanensis]|nr:conserved hypothetical protein [Cupriavidus taiwanensis]
MGRASMACRHRRRAPASGVGCERHENGGRGVMGNSRLRDLTGAECGSLKVVSIGRKNGHHQYWLCICACGETKEVRSDVITGKKQKSCGCTSKNRRHGMAGTSVYNVWQNMLRRCRDPKNRAYQDYGGRGITVCERWLIFENFYADMGDIPPSKTLDRINNSLGYSPENCRWATIHEQARNTRSNRMISLNGETKSLAEWCEILEQPYARINRRIFTGMDPVEALLQRGDLRRMNGSL